MGAAYVVLLVGVTLAIVAIAIYLIAVIVNLAQVFKQLDVILGAVVTVNEKTEVLAPVLEEIRSELAAASQAAEGVAGRLAQRFPPPDAEEQDAAAFSA